MLPGSMRANLVGVAIAVGLGAAMASCVGLPPPPPRDDLGCDASTTERDYEECEQGLCDADQLCAVDASPPSFTVCAQTGCEDDCDCPAPSSGTARPICSSFVDASLPRACTLACDDHEECPEGMICAGWSLCMYPI